MDGLEGPPGRRRWLIELMVAVVVLVVGVAPLALLGPDDTTAPARPLADRKDVVVLGGPALQGVDLAAAVSGLDIDFAVRVFPSAGMSRSASPDAQALVPSVRKELSGGPVDLLVVQGGELDQAAPPEEVSQATPHLIDWFRANHPGADLVLVGPLQGAPQVELAMRTAALARGVRFVRGAADAPALAVQLADVVRTAVGTVWDPGGSGQRAAKHSVSPAVDGDRARRLPRVSGIPS